MSLALDQVEERWTVEAGENARAACQGIRMMLKRDLALAEQLGVTVFFGGTKARETVHFDDLSFHHEDLM